MENAKTKGAIKEKLLKDILKSANHDHERDFIENVKSKLKHTELEVFQTWELDSFDINHVFNVTHEGIECGRTLLHMAFEYGFEEAIEFLLDKGADVESQNCVGCTPLMLAAKPESTEVKMALDAEADTKNETENRNCVKTIANRERHLELLYKFLNNRDTKLGPDPKITVLHLAATIGDLPTIKILVEKGFDVNAKSSGNISPVGFAAKNGNLDAVKYFIEELRCDTEPFLLLSLSAFSGNIELVRYFVEDLQCEMELEKDDTSPAILAADKGHDRIVEYLLDKDESLLRHTHESGKSVLHAAVLSGNLRLIQNLIRREADFMAPLKIHWSSLYDHKTSKISWKFSVDDFRNIWQVSVLHIAASKGFLVVFQYLTDVVRIDYNICDPECIVPLHLAAANGHLELVKYLIEVKNLEADFQNTHGITPLHLACDSGHLEVVKYLIEGGGVSANVKDAKHWTPLHFAATNDNIDVINYLVLKKADVEARDAKKTTPFLCACKSGLLNVVKHFVEVLKVDYTVENFEGWTALFYASAHAYMDILKYLVEELNIDCASPGSQKWTALYLATVNKIDSKIIKYLVEKGADVNALSDKLRTPLQGAIYSGNLEMAKYLIEKGARLYLVDENGHTVLCPAIEKGHLDVTKYLIEECKMSIETTDISNRTVLHLAVHSGRLKLVEYLLENTEAKKFINTRRFGNRWTPLYEAVAKGFYKIAEYMLANGALVNATEFNANTCLHKAAARGDLRIVKLLIENRANINPKNKAGTTPLHQAVKFGNRDVIRYLLEKGANVRLTDKRGNTPIDLATAKETRNFLKELVSEFEN